VTPPLPQERAKLLYVNVYSTHYVPVLYYLQDLACLQMFTADQAFTNAKAAGDVEVKFHSSTLPYESHHAFRE
jgi:hypothetical protein